MGRSLAFAVLAVAAASTIASRTARAECSPSGLDEVRMELRAASVPDCGPKTLRRAFARACDRAAVVTERALVQCASAKAPRVGRAHHMLMGLLGRMDRPTVARKLTTTCDDAYRTQITRLDAELIAAANGTEITTTTTTSPPGTPTTTTQPACAMVSLEVDKGDCTRVTSVPRGLVECGAACDVATFTVPGFAPLRLDGVAAPGDVGVTFGGDCEDDGTVDLEDASPPDCSLSCDCSSGS